MAEAQHKKEVTMATTMQVTHGNYAHYDKYERVENGMTWSAIIFMICVLVPIVLFMYPIRGASTLWEFITHEWKILRTKEVRFDW